MVKKAEVIWMDGEFIPWDRAQVHVLTHTLHYGLGVFEGIRSYRTVDDRVAVFRLPEHVRRFYDSAKIVMMDIPTPPAELEAVCKDIIVRNGGDPMYLRPLAFLGDGKMGLGAMDNAVRVVVAAWEWGAYLGADGMSQGIRAKVSTFTRPLVNSSMVKGKIVGQYVNSILAKREALLQGFDEAILLDPQGYVSEASGENIFAVRDGTIWTAPLTGTVLAGITRDSVLTLARDLGYEVREERFTRDFLWTADEVFMCGTAAEVTPVREIDNRAIGTGRPGEVAASLQKAFFAAARGEDARYAHWLSYID